MPFQCQTGVRFGARDRIAPFMAQYEIEAYAAEPQQERVGLGDDCRHRAGVCRRRRAQPHRPEGGYARSACPPESGPEPSSGGKGRDDAMGSARHRQASGGAAPRLRHRSVGGDSAHPVRRDGLAQYRSVRRISSAIGPDSKSTPSSFRFPASSALLGIALCTSAASPTAAPSARDALIAVFLSDLHWKMEI